MTTQPTDDGSLKVPAAHYGGHKEVRKSWRAVLRAAIAARSWDAALPESAMISLEDVPGGLVLGGPDRAVQGRHFMFCAVMKQLLDVAYLGYERRDESYETM